MRKLIVLMLCVSFASVCAGNEWSLIGTQWSISSVNKARKYETAYEKAVNNNEQLSIFITTNGCAPCVRLKKKYGTKLSKLSNYVELNASKDNAIVGRITSKPSYPQLIIYKPNNGKWRKTTYIGYDDIIRYTDGSDKCTTCSSCSSCGCCQK